MKNYSDQSGGFHYYVTEEQVAYHKRRSLDDILTMNEQHAQFLYEFQTEDERKRMRILKGKLQG